MHKKCDFISSNFIYWHHDKTVVVRVLYTTTVLFKRNAYCMDRMCHALIPKEEVQVELLSWINFAYRL